VNFLGAGENLEFQIQQGKRIKNRMFGFTEPYVFDQPITAGFNIYDRYYDYSALGLYTQKAQGVDLNLGARIVGYWRANVTYTIQKINMSYAEGTTYAAIYGSTGKFYESSITPMLYRSTIDSPLTPTRGTMYSASLKYAGSFLGGDIDILKPQVEFSHYQPFIAKHVIGVHVEYEFIKSYYGSQVPYWERIFLGGERSIRGYEVYTIGPRNESGVNLGGTKALVLNAEYIIPVGGPVYAIFFYDVGNALAAGEKFSRRNMYTSTGFEARIFIPALRVPFRLIFAYNNRKVYVDQGNFAFRFAVGTTF
jgi:outer membrane protein insertion porin family